MAVIFMMAILFFLGAFLDWGDRAADHAGQLSVAALRSGRLLSEIRGAPGISLGIIFRSLLPFIGLQIIAIALLIAFPGITGR